MNLKSVLMRMIMRELIVKFLKKIKMYNIMVRIFGGVDEKISYLLKHKDLMCICKEINEIIAKIAKKEKKNKIAYIFQYSYYNAEGTEYISGGGERYASDLSDILFQMGFVPILFQIGTEKQHFWLNKRNHLYVIGIGVQEKYYRRIINKFLNPQIAIYSGFVSFGDKYYNNNIMISHGITWDNPFSDVKTKMIKKIMNSTKSIVSVDTNTISWLRSSFANSLNNHPKKMAYIPNYVDLERFRPNYNLRNNNIIKIVFPRRCSDERGFWLFAEVIPKLLDNYMNLKIEFVGYIHTEKIRERIEKLIATYPGKVIQYLCDPSQMAKVYQSADITVIPTLYSEGTSLSCLESMACGCATVATNIGGLPNLIIDKYNGLLINPDAKDLYRALRMLIDNKELRNTISINALSICKVFSMEKWKEEWKRIIDTTTLG